MELPGSALPGMQSIQIVAPCDPDELIEIGVHLRYPPESTACSLTAKLSMHLRAHVDHDSFASMRGATCGDVGQLECFADEHNLAIGHVNTEARLVTLTGNVANLNKAFAIQLGECERHGRRFRAYAGSLTVPTPLAPIIIAVEGLSTWSAIRRHCGAGSRSVATTAPAGSFLPTQIAALYRFPADASGKGQSIALIELAGGFEPDVVQSYFANVLHRPPPKISVREIAGGRNNPGDAEGNAEVYLDVLVAGAVAPDAEIVIYFADITRWAEAIKTAVHDPDYQHGSISYSYGQSEKWCLLTDDSGLTADVIACEEALRDAACLGITFCAPTGDLGSHNGEDDGLAHANYPASSIYALACAGTTVSTAAGSIADEVVWQNGEKHATGGGVSRLFSRPDYQKAAGVCARSVNPGADTGRGVADVAGHADDERGYYVYAPDPRVMGGTSAVAPLWAGLIALLNEKLGRRVGYINPHLYPIAAPASALRDITNGGNGTVAVPGYQATPGWDPCSGWGSPDGMALLKTFMNPDAEEGETR
jgi:kumamolisin